MDKEKLIQFIKNNKNSPLLILGISENVFKNATIIKASIPSSELGIIPGQNGLIYPNWLQEVIKNNQENISNLLVISNIDSIPLKDQEKFIGMLKYKGVNGYKFPKETQVILTSKSKEMQNISTRILTNVLIYK